MTTAAIYARKSTEQTGVADEQKSVARQVEHARQYATLKGWTVDESAIFVDDGISGAEFAGRPGFVRLMNALKPRPPFQVLVMSEESRLGREAIETRTRSSSSCKPGVRVFFYLEDRERTLDSPTDKIESANGRGRVLSSCVRRVRWTAAQTVRRVRLQSVADRAGRNRARDTYRTQMVPAGRWQAVVAGRR